MKLSTRTRYGMRAMVELTRLDHGSPVMLRSISLRQELPEKYLEQLFSRLRNAGLVKSDRGKFGGYRLARPAKEITALDIAIALDGPIDLVACVTDPESCAKKGICPTLALWRELTEAVHKVLAGKTLEELAAPAPGDGMWYI